MVLTRKNRINPTAFRCITSQHAVYMLKGLRNVLVSAAVTPHDHAAFHIE